MRLLLISLISFCSGLHADTINNYMKIANNIPQMEIKADPQAQAWARSAHHVLTITCESIAETMIQANETAKSQGKPIFCLPAGTQLNSINLNELIQQTYKEISSQQSDKDKMTVSQIAWLGVSKQYPCQTNAGNQMAQAHVSSLLGK
ncbi:phosphatase [Legionella maioricensis]|uniref:Phosphatase n=1 Tax=Legionella maioricensis TaxID=2896528 RepID=A0A9X2CZ03_9GAMM|nr:phosphatase [Legionella maioricensis]MCL9683279.1 phosphatase [Legionella maioricensis]MCL9686024.1 phosphatase [Legionella maioricensis]